MRARWCSDWKGDDEELVTVKGLNDLGLIVVVYGRYGDGRVQGQVAAFAGEGGDLVLTSLEKFFDKVLANCTASLGITVSVFDSVNIQG